MPSSASKGVRAVIFDLGGVLTESPFDAFARYERDRGLPEGFLRSLNAANHDTNSWARLERGQLTVEEFAKSFEVEASARGHSVDAAAVLTLLSGEIRPTMVEAVRTCAEHYLVGMITNNFRRVPGDTACETASPDQRPELRAALDLFDVVVESSAVGARKPEPAIYEIALERLDVTSSEAVFIDDLGVNLKPAREMGMHTIKFVTEPQVLTELGEVLGLAL